MALAQLDLFEGRFPEALVEFKKHSDETYQQMGEAIVEYSLGHEKKSQQARESLIATHAGSSAYDFADVYAWRGEKDKALPWFDRAYVQHDDNLTDIKIDSSLSSVRGDPRYGELLKKLKLPQ